MLSFRVIPMIDSHIATLIFHPPLQNCSKFVLQIGNRGKPGRGVRETLQR